VRTVTTHTALNNPIAAAFERSDCLSLSILDATVAAG
jgi:hypothetical protein